VYKSIAASGKEATMTPNLRTVIGAVVFAALFLALYPAQAQIDSPLATLNQYISDLQKNPGDNVLREKIIKHVQTMSPTPTIPEEAKKYINRGMAAAEDAKSEKDYKDAADEFQKAVNLAPWLGAGYRGLAVTQDKAGQYSQALQNLKFFLLTNPPASDVEAAKTLRDKIEYRQEKAARTLIPQPIAPAGNSDDTLLMKIDGRRYVYNEVLLLDVQSHKLVIGYYDLRDNNKYKNQKVLPLSGRKAYNEIDFGGIVTYTISQDGDTIFVSMPENLKKWNPGMHDCTYVWDKLLH